MLKNITIHIIYIMVIKNRSERVINNHLLLFKSVLLSILQMYNIILL